MTDDDLFAWSAAQHRWLLTENVKDFRPIMLRALQAGGAITGLLFTSSRAFPRSRRNPGPLIQAIHAWLTSGPPVPPLKEDWLRGLVANWRGAFAGAGAVAPGRQGLLCRLDPLSAAYGNALVHGGVRLGLAFPVVGVEVGDRHGRAFNDRRDVTA
jgi:hypothetical protein